MILVTGGAGFIGSALVNYLNSIGQTNILIVDRLGHGEKWCNLKGLKFDFYIHADEFLQEYKNFYPSIKAIYHLGACSDTTEKNMDYLWKNNVLFSQKLFTLAAQNNMKFLYASSAATYGNGEWGYQDKHELIPKLRPLNPYGYSKQLFDEWVFKQKRFPPRWYGVKFFNVYGPNEYHKGKMVSVIYQAFQQVKEIGTIRLFKSYRKEYGDGEQLRDFIYVKDAVRAMVEMMELPSSSFSGIYNLGTGVARSFNDLARATFKGMEQDPKIEYFDMPLGLRDQYQYHTEADMEKFRNIFPQFRFMSLEEGIADYIHLHLQKTNPYLEME